MVKDDRGFSLVEVVAVMAVTGVLAGIALALSIDARLTAQDREAMTAVRTAQVALELHHQDEEDYAATEQRLEALEPSLRSARDLTVETTRETYAAAVRSRSGTRFVLTRDREGAVARSCDRPARGACRAGGEW